MHGSITDNLTAAGAEHLSRRLQRYWEERGRHDFQFDVEHESNRRDSKLPVSLYVVRSNIRFRFPAPAGEQTGRTA